MIDHFLKEMAGRYRREVTGPSRAARQSLMAYDWPGNIRQLRNAIERMVLLDNDGILDVDDLPEEIAPVCVGEEEHPLAGLSHGGADSLVGRTLQEVEKHYIQQALELTEGKREEAAKLLGIGERTLYRKIKEYGL